MLIAPQHHDHISREYSAEAFSFHQVAHASRRMAGSGDCLDEHVSQRNRLTPLESDIDASRVEWMVRHVKRAEERLARSSVREDQGVASSGVNHGSCRNAQGLGSPGVVTV